MLPAIAGILLIAALLWIFVLGSKAARTRKLAMMGMVPAGCSLGAFAWSAFHPGVELVVHIAQAFIALAAGFAHAIAFSLIALPPRKVWLRLVFVQIGLWACTFAALWFALPQRELSLEIALALLGSLTISTWLSMPFYTRDRGWMQRGNKRMPSVRFACPRCGTRVDWGTGVGACTDCGLFMHLQWPADELQKKRAETATAAEPRPARTVRFACPACERASDWPRGDNTCCACGLKLSIHWNVHVRAAESKTAR